MIAQVIFAMNFIRNLLLCFSLALAFTILRHLLRKEFKTEIMKIKKPVFIFLAVAVIFFTLGFLFMNPYEPPSQATFTLLNTIFFSISYAAFIAGLAYFWHQVGKLHKLSAYEAYFFIGVTSGVFIWLHYLVETALIPASASQPLFKQVLLLLHPLAVGLIFLLTLSIHPRHKDKIIQTPLVYISNAAFLYFIGYMMLAYSLANPSPAWLSIAFSALFMLSAFFFFLGFFVAEKQFKRAE